MNILKKSVKFKQIASDIDKFFAAMDSVGTVTIMGGEPFMHPDLSKIVNKLLEKKKLWDCINSNFRNISY